MLRRLVKFLLLLLVLGAVGLVIYAYIGNLAPEPEDHSLPVTLDAQ